MAMIIHVEEDYDKNGEQNKYDNNKSGRQRKTDGYDYI